jgi:4-hydroxy-tetrahydrodipicolinate synthase
MFAGLSAFPLTPMDERGIDEAAFVSLVTRLAEAGVDSIGALGSTGNYAYLTREERSRVARLAVEAAGGTPVMVSVGSTRTSHVIELVDGAPQYQLDRVLARLGLLTRTKEGPPCTQ